MWELNWEEEVGRSIVFGGGAVLGNILGERGCGRGKEKWRKCEKKYWLELPSDTHKPSQLTKVTTMDCSFRISANGRIVTLFLEAKIREVPTL
jgi:hypothetical protein